MFVRYKQEITNNALHQKLSDRVTIASELLDNMSECVDFFKPNRNMRKEEDYMQKHHTSHK
jgi:hypothetical protein